MSFKEKKWEVSDLFFPEQFKQDSKLTKHDLMLTSNIFRFSPDPIKIGLNTA